MNTANLKKSTSLRLDRELYNYIEKLAKKENRSVNNFIETVLAEATHFHEPNAETKKAIEDARKERHTLKRYKNSKDLFDDLMSD
ncbi:ribbon-helix-helix protein, CopG family [Albibacterium indicum]|uniref:ribbon-helix-helix protein, CopG family n=1 Tax=Albibacterium indicum TaxID=2292082 RepID=UPI00197D2FF3|nr:ribbon-helix-helix protein, CopG family [Pedobacter indicus]